MFSNGPVETNDEELVETNNEALVETNSEEPIESIDEKEITEMNPEKILCACNKVSKGDILKAMDQGASTYKEVKKITGAGSRCGVCKDRVKKFIKKHRSDAAE